ncbi:DUF998 domain-containing protein [Mycobacterium sp.]|uniref:DUF998 domain-containing protein n=1 Tax=Mycobacterium sp. TaxID=1785 RepID=UPI002602B188|nr:DUF998 domain-containing protein [Mycobacterium sp.]
MTSSARDLHKADVDLTAASSRRRAIVRRWAWLGLAAQAVFVASLLVPAFWQGPHYSAVAHTISDMYAVTAPHGGFLVVVLSLCGAATIGFALRSVWSQLRPGGWRAATGSVLLALSIVGLGDLLSPVERLACRMADPGCTAMQQLSNTGGQLDNAISSIGLLLLVIGAFFLAAAMRRTHGWEGWARPTRWTAALITAFAVASVLTQGAGYTGLFERLVATTGAATLAVLAIGILRRTRGRS